MKREEFLNLIINKCDIEETGINESTVLGDLEEWDSLSFITLLALFKNNFGFSPDINALKECKTFGEILDFAGDKYEC